MKTEAVPQRCSIKELFAAKGKHLYRSLFLVKVQAESQKETLTRVFSSNFYEIFRTIFHRASPDGCLYIVENFTQGNSQRPEFLKQAFT